MPVLIVRYTNLITHFKSALGTSWAGRVAQAFMADDLLDKSSPAHPQTHWIQNV